MAAKPAIHIAIARQNADEVERGRDGGSGGQLIVVVVRGEEVGGVLGQPHLGGKVPARVPRLEVVLRAEGQSGRRNRVGMGLMGLTDGGGRRECTHPYITAYSSSA